LRDVADPSGGDDDPPVMLLVDDGHSSPGGKSPPRIKNSQNDDFGVFYDEGDTDATLKSDDPQTIAHIGANGSSFGKGFELLQEGINTPDVGSSNAS
jgi:hypothetical protein